MIGGLCQAPRYSSSVPGFGSFCACGWRLPAGLEPGSAFPVTSRHRRCRVAPRGASAAVHGLVYSRTPRCTERSSTLPGNWRLPCQAFCQGLSQSSSRNECLGGRVQEDKPAVLILCFVLCSCRGQFCILGHCESPHRQDVVVILQKKFFFFFFKARKDQFKKLLTVSVLRSTDG